MDERLDFSQRAELEEEMDGPCSFEELRDCLRDLAVVNSLTRAHRPVMEWMEELTSILTSENPDVGHPRRLKIVDVGCGYGDLLRRIERWAVRRGVAVDLVGVDLNPNAVRAAKEATGPESRIRWFAGDVYECAEAADADGITANGMTHHLAEAEIVRLLEWMERTALHSWCIVDLHRKPVPYKLFSAAMHGPWWHRFIRADGLRSIRRSFVAADWVRMCSAAGVGEAEIRGYRPARLRVVGRKRR